MPYHRLMRSSAIGMLLIAEPSSMKKVARRSDARKPEEKTLEVKNGVKSSSPRFSRSPSKFKPFRMWIQTFKLAPNLWFKNKYILYLFIALCSLLVNGIYKIMIIYISESSTYVTVRWKMRRAAHTGEHMIHFVIVEKLVLLNWKKSNICD